MVEYGGEEGTMLGAEMVLNRPTFEDGERPLDLALEPIAASAGVKGGSETVKSFWLTPARLRRAKSIEFFLFGNHHFAVVRDNKS